MTSDQERELIETLKNIKELLMHIKTFGVEVWMTEEDHMGND